MVDPNSDTRLVVDEDGRPALSPSVQLRLEVCGGPAAGRVVLMEAGALLVGRASDTDLRIETDQAMSRHHFAIEARGAEFWLLDMGSANGTLLDGRRVDKTGRLRDGDLLEAGQSTFRVSIGTAPRSPSPPRPQPRPSRPKAAPPPKRRAKASARTESAARAPGADERAPPRAPAIQRRLVRCEFCEKLVTVERATVLVDDYGHVLSQAGPESFVCKECRLGSDDVADVHFPGYRTLEVVGEGNMGAVYLVERDHDRALFALKALRPDAELSEPDIRRFLREAASLSALDHPNIIGFVDQGYVEGEFYFVMDYIEGVDLDLYRRQAGGRVPLGRCVHLVGQILDGLDYAHRQGFVHRDVKPANILVGVVDGAMTPKLSDFGLAKRYQETALDPITRGHISFGTPDYMPPEQITSFRDIGPRSDIYAVGATLYHLLSGETLYEGIAGPDPIRMLLEVDPPKLHRRAPYVPTPIADVVQRAIARQPNDRWPSASVFKDSLMQALRLCR